MGITSRGGDSTRPAFPPLALPLLRHDPVAALDRVPRKSLPGEAGPRVAPVDSRLPDLVVEHEIRSVVAVHVLDMASPVCLGAVALARMVVVPEADALGIDQGGIEGRGAQDGDGDDAPRRNGSVSYGSRACVDGDVRGDRLA